MSHLETPQIRKHNFPKHRYKYGKQKKAIGLPIFERMLRKVDKIELGKHKPLTVKSFLSVLFWTGLRKTEVCGAKQHRYVLPACREHEEPIVKYTDAIPGIVFEDLEIKGDTLVIECVARKGGRRTAPLELWLEFPHVNLIVEQWKKGPQENPMFESEGGWRVWPISEWDAWNLVKQIDQKKYPHFLRFNRITELCANPKLSVADICSWTGLTPTTIDSYMERSGRFVKRTANAMREQYKEVSHA